MINKNISIWRGSATPPTNYHLWEKEDGGLYVYLDEKWQHLIAPADKIILDEHQQQLDKIKNLALTEIDPIDTNTYKSYQLKSDDNIFGTTINIPKDRFIKQVTLGYDNATIDESTGIITIGTGLSKEYLLFSVVLESGSYELVSINLTNFLTEKDYSDGLEVVDNKLKVKVDPSSEEYLKVTNNGIKVEGINTKVSSTVDDIKNKIQNGDWISIKAGRDIDGNINKGAISEGTNTTASAQQAHAEGFACNAKGVGSHAEGYNTNATEQGSHSEGRDTQSNALYAHAEGFKTLANGISSHAEGYSTQTIGNYSHSEGVNSIAKGYCSHVEGYNTEAKGNYSHAEGVYNYATNNFLHMTGIGNEDYRKNAYVIYVKRGSGGIPDLSDKKTGYMYLLGIGDYSGQDITEDMKSVQEVLYEHSKIIKDISIIRRGTGELSSCLGRSTKAKGLCSHAEGEDTIASGYYSHAQGSCNYNNVHFIDTVGIGRTSNTRLNASVIYVGRDNIGYIDTGDLKNGYQYLIDVGGYRGQAIEEGMKSVQEVFADLENNKVDKTDMITITNDEIDEMFNK